ncbi:MAG: HD domain-containing protein [Methanobacterium sp.]|uniref:3'-5' exoribonuclease YhaM family protein n=1 Tax=Methanobacterium sp. TaxID=2164 RepID=UPI003D662652|nr:HD domain-containing protein [Methanobacterium sp.]
MFKKNDEDYVKNLDSKRRIRTQFVVADKVEKRAKSGKKYIDFTLSDKTGQIIGRKFSDVNINEIFDKTEIGKIHRVLGDLNEFPRGSGKYNIIIDTITELNENEYDINDFIKTSEKNRDKLMLEIYSTIEEMENVYFIKLLNSFFFDEKFKKKFFDSPSAKMHHHNYIGGLLEHSVEVLEICKFTCKIFPELDKDLLHTGAILHDIGKIKTYTYDLVSIDFSEEGRLLDHLFISCDMVKEKINEIEMPEELSNQILHLILSHHGDVRNGWGSPVNPLTPEAVALHHADNLDAKVKGMLQNK